MVLLKGCRVCRDEATGGKRDEKRRQTLNGVAGVGPRFWGFGLWDSRPWASGPPFENLNGRRETGGGWGREVKDRKRRSVTQKTGEKRDRDVSLPRRWSLTVLQEHRTGHPNYGRHQPTHNWGVEGTWNELVPVRSPCWR